MNKAEMERIWNFEQHGYLKRITKGRRKLTKYVVKNIKVKFVPNATFFSFDEQYEIYASSRAQAENKFLLANAKEYRILTKAEELNENKIGSYSIQYTVLQA